MRKTQPVRPALVRSGGSVAHNRGRAEGIVAHRQRTHRYRALRQRRRIGPAQKETGRAVLGDPAGSVGRRLTCGGVAECHRPAEKIKLVPDKGNDASGRCFRQAPPNRRQSRIVRSDISRAAPRWQAIPVRGFPTSVLRLALKTVWAAPSLRSGHALPRARARGRARMRSRPIRVAVVAASEVQ